MIAMELPSCTLPVLCLLPGLCKRVRKPVVGLTLVSLLPACQVPVTCLQRVGLQIIMFDQYPTEPDHHDAHHQQHQQGRRPQHPISSRHGSTAQQTCLVGEASHAQFVADLVHLISLLHGVSSAALRRDPDLSNMKRHR